MTDLRRHGGDDLRDDGREARARAGLARDARESASACGCGPRDTPASPEGAPTPPPAGEGVGPVPDEPVRNGEGSRSVFQPGGERFVHFTGRGRDLFLLHLVNCALIVLTLGVYTFWAKTRLREYLWGKTLLFGEPLEYTGTGWQLCRSFLAVISLFFLVNLALTLLMMLSPVAGMAFSLLFMLALVLFWPYAVYSALRFRLARTCWRGVHGRLKGLPLEYAAQAWVRSMLTAVTLGLFAPHATAFLTAFIVNNAHVGTQPCRFEADVKKLSHPYYVCWIVGAVLLGAALWALGSLAAERGFDRHNPDPVLFAPLALWALGLLAVRLAYGVICLNWSVRGVRFGGASLDCRVPVSGYAWLTLSNGLLIACTLGLALPWAVARRYRYLADRVFIRGEADWAEVRQDDDGLPRSGEGLLSFFDLDLGF